MGITSMFNLLSNWTTHPITSLALFLDGVVYNLLAYSYKLFSLMCQLNFNELYGLIKPLIDRAKALIIVIIMYKVAVALITSLLNPDQAPKKGTELIKNIFIAAALLVSYTFIFGVMNELSILVIGSSTNYEFVYLKEIAGVTDGEDEGLINRFIFGGKTDFDAGSYIALNTLKVFLVDTTNSNVIEKKIGTGDSIDFTDLPEVADEVDKSLKYTPIISAICGGYLAYVIIKCAIEIGVRMFKLLVLQLVAPIAIITIVNSGTKGGKFKTFCSTYIQVYIEAFTRIAAMLIVTVLISKFIVNVDALFGITADTDLSWVTGGLLKIITIIAGFKFAQEAPKFIDKLLGTHMGDAKGGNFGSFLGKLAFGGAGAIVGGIAGGGLAGAVKGAQVASKGIPEAFSKGNGIAGTIKGLMDTTNNTRKSAIESGISAKSAGGYFNQLMQNQRVASGTNLKRISEQDENIKAATKANERLNTSNEELDRYETMARESIRNNSSSYKYAGSNEAINYGTDVETFSSTVASNNEKVLEAERNIQLYETRLANAPTASDQSHYADVIQNYKKTRDLEYRKAHDEAKNAYNNALDRSSAAHGTTVEGRRRSKEINDSGIRANNERIKTANDLKSNLEKGKL